MFERKPLRALIRAAAAVIAFTAVGALPSAKAALISTPLGGTHWSMTYDSDEVSGVVLTDFSTFKLLSYIKTFHTSAPITITFDQTTAAAEDNFGLRITLNETILNQSGADWDGFGAVLGGPTYTQPGTSSSHPGFAHFHDDSARLGFTFFLPFTSVSAFNGQNTIALGSGTLSNGADGSFRGVGLHQWEALGADRDFTLIETPHVMAVPEPHALSLLALLALGLTLARRRRT